MNFLSNGKKYSIKKVKYHIVSFWDLKSLIDTWISLHEGILLYIYEIFEANHAKSNKTRALGGRQHHQKYLWGIILLRKYQNYIVSWKFYRCKSLEKFKDKFNLEFWIWIIVPFHAILRLICDSASCKWCIWLLRALMG